MNNKELNEKQKNTLHKMQERRWADYINLRDKIEKEIKLIDKVIENGKNRLEQIRAEEKTLINKLIGFRYGKGFLEKMLQNSTGEIENKNIETSDT